MPGHICDVKKGQDMGFDQSHLLCIMYKIIHWCQLYRVEALIQLESC